MKVYMVVLCTIYIINTVMFEKFLNLWGLGKGRSGQYPRFYDLTMFLQIYENVKYLPIKSSVFVTCESVIMGEAGMRPQAESTWGCLVINSLRLS